VTRECFQSTTSAKEKRRRRRRRKEEEGEVGEVGGNKTIIRRDIVEIEKIKIGFKIIDC